ncbi:BppU family phage baseplate upper protein [Paucilactobacillus sp. N302-9]
METLRFVIGKDQRVLIQPSDDVTSTAITWTGKHNFVQARQYDNELRSVMVYITHEDGSAFDLTGMKAIFEGLTPAGYKIFDDHGFVAVDPSNGQFRYDFPQKAFANSGNYKQSFFRLTLGDKNVSTLEFELNVLSDAIVNGVVASDYISPFEDLYDQLKTIIDNASGDLTKFKDDWNTQIQAAFDKWTGDYQTIENTVTSLQTQIDALAAEIKSNQIVTVPMMQSWIDKITDTIAKMHVLTSMKVGTLTLRNGDELYPSIHAYVYRYGAGIAQTSVDIAGGSTVYDIKVRAVRTTPTEVDIYIDPEEPKTVFSGFTMPDNFTADFGKSFLYLTSGNYSLGIEAKGATVTSFDTDSSFKL